MDKQKWEIVMAILLMALALSLVISATAWPIAWYNYSINAKAMEHGYDQAALPGSTGIYWVKRTPADDR